MSDFNRRIGGHTPTLSFLDGPTGWRHVARSKNWTYQTVVIGPSRVVLFYGRHSMGEGLKVDEARDATFLLTGAGMWVGELAYLTTNPRTIQEGKRAIAQAVSDNRVKVRGWGIPMWICWPNSPSGSMLREHLLQKMCPEIAVLMIPEHPVGPLEAENAIGEEETRGLHHLGFLHLPPDHGFESDRSSLSMMS